MSLFSLLLPVIHLIGLALAVGAATVKLLLLLKCSKNYEFATAYIKVSKPITGLIILGLILLTLSGIGWLLLGFPITTRLIVKLVLVAAVWIIGPVIDHAIEPKFQKLVSSPGEPASLELVKSHKKLLAFEIVATGLFYVIILMWLLV